MSNPPLCMETGLRRCMGKEELHFRFLRIFENEQQEVCRKIATAIGDRDLPSAIALAHGLVSRAGLIGAETLSELASALEESLRDADLSKAEALAQALSMEHTQVLRAIGMHLQQHH